MNNYTPAKKSQAMVKASNDIIANVKLLKPGLIPLLGGIINGKPRAERLIRMVENSMKRTPKLFECDPFTLYGAAMACAELQLEPGAGLGHAYMLPFANKGRMECQLIIGYQGMIQVAERDGNITVDAQVVYENDDFDYELGLNPTMYHKPAEADPGPVKYAYAIARYKDGRFKFRVITKHEIEQARETSKAGKSSYSPWGTHYPEMARKTAVRRLFKMLPKTVAMGAVQAIEEQAELGRSQNLLYNPEKPEPVLEATAEYITEDDIPFGNETQVEVKK